MRAMLPRGPQGGVSEGCMSDLSRQTLQVLSCAGLLNDLFGVGASVRVQFSEQPKLALAESGQKWCTHPTHPRNHVQKTKGRANLVHQTRALKLGACSWVSDACWHPESPSYIRLSNSLAAAPPTVSQAADEQC